MVNLNKSKHLAKEKGWSMSFLCSKMGVGAGYFTDIKNGKHKSTPDRLKQITELLDTTPEYLTDQTEIRESRVSDETDKRTQEINDIMKLVKKKPDSINYPAMLILNKERQR